VVWRFFRAKQPLYLPFLTTMSMPIMRKIVEQFGLKNLMRLLAQPSCASGTFPTDESTMSFWQSFNSRRAAEAVCGYLELDADLSDGDDIKRAFFAFVKGKTLDELPRCFMWVLFETEAQFKDVHEWALETFYRDGVGDSATVYFMPARVFVSRQGDFFPIEFDPDEDEWEHEPNWFAANQQKYRAKLAVVNRAMPMRKKVPLGVFEVVLSFLAPMGVNEAAFYQRIYKYFRVHFPDQLEALDRPAKRSAKRPRLFPRPVERSLGELGVAGGTGGKIAVAAAENVGGAKRAAPKEQPARFVVPRLRFPQPVAAQAEAPATQGWRLEVPQLPVQGCDFVDMCALRAEPLDPLDSTSGDDAHFKALILRTIGACEVARPAKTEPPWLRPNTLELLKRVLTIPDSDREYEFTPVATLKTLLRRMEGDVYGPKAALIARLEESDARAFEEVLDARLLFLDPEKKTEQTREQVLRVLSTNGIELKHAAAPFKKDPEVVWTAVRSNYKAFMFASPTIFHETEANARTAVQMNGNCLQQLSQALRADRSVVLAAILTNPEAIRYAQCPIDDELLMAAISKPGFGNLIDYGNPYQRGEPNEAGVANLAFALTAVKTSADGHALSWIENLDARHLVRFDAVRANGSAIQYYGGYLKDEEAHEQVDLRRCYDYDLVRLALENDGLALEHAATHLQDDYELVEMAVRQNPFAFKYASNRLKANAPLALLVAEKSFVALDQSSKKRLHLPQELHRTAVSLGRAYARSAFLAFERGTSKWTTASGAMVLKARTGTETPATLLSAHGPHFFKSFLNKIAAFLGDETGAKTAGLAKSAYNLKYADVSALPHDHISKMRAKRDELQHVFKLVCARAGGARFEGHEVLFTGGYTPVGAAPPRQFTAEERHQVLLYLASATDDYAQIVVARHLQSGNVPQLPRATRPPAQPIRARF
jgi:hypothetical protein